MKRAILISTVIHLLVAAALVAWPAKTVVRFPRRTPIPVVPVVAPPPEPPAPEEETKKDDALAVATRPPAKPTNTPTPKPTVTRVLKQTAVPSVTPTPTARATIAIPTPELPRLKDLPTIPPVAALPTRRPDDLPQGDFRPATGGSEGGMSFDTDVPYSAYAAYLIALERKCSRYWSGRIPKLAPRDGALTLRVTLHFDIAADGTIGTIRVTESSGMDAFDRSAAEAVGDIGNAGALPAAFGGRTITVVAPFEHTY